jgi:outer membrane protein TolC
VVCTGASLRFLCAKVLICWVVTCHAQTYSPAASGTSGQAVSGANGGNPFAGSVPTKLVAGRMPLSLQDAVNLGLRHNLGLLLSRADTRAARGQRWQELSALLPHVTAAPYVAESKLNLPRLVSAM